jgi:Immunoglobulin-like domain of bacterial spore germination/Sporulation and spore germination
MRTASLALYAALTVGLAAGLAACSEDDPVGDDQTPAGATATDTATQDPTEDPAEEPTATDSASSGGDTDGDGGAATGATVPVYYVGDTPQGPRLFREFQQVSGDPLLEAATLVDGGSPLDPDYRTEWPGVGIESVQATDGVLLVTIPGDGFTDRPDGMSKRSARLALQQLVYTLQGVQQERVPVQVQRTGADPVLFGISTESPFTNAPALDVMGLVNVTSPEQGETVDGDTLEASGVASSFEATVPWEILRGDEVVLDGFATAEGWMDRLYPWEASIDVSGLEPGDYTFVARTDDPSGGAEGAGPHEDTKDFTLR